METNLLFDYLPSSSSSSSIYAGNFNLLTSKRIGQRILYSFVVKLISNDCLDSSTPLNRDFCLAEFPKYSSSSPLVCRAKFSMEPLLRPWRRRKSSTLYLDALTAKVVGRHVQCRIEGKWRRITPF